MNRGTARAQEPHRTTARLFVAVPLPDAWREALADAQEQLRRVGLRLRFVRPEGIHLTLAFLGEVGVDRIEAIAAALGAIRLDGPPRLELAAAGTFGSSRRPRVVWAGVGGDLASLGAVHREVGAALEPLGFPPEDRPFRPHLTIARVPEGLTAADAAAIAPAVERLALGPRAPFVADAFDLMESHLGPGGARYERLRRWSLIGPSDAGDLSQSGM